MRIKSNFVLQEIADEYIIVPIAEEANRMHGVIRLNETGAFLWNKLLDGTNTIDEIEKAYVSEYNVDEPKAHADISVFLKQINELGCIDN